MIRAVIHKRQGDVISYEIKGHAKSGEYGHDVVCAAVSVLGITTANNLYKLANIRPDAKMESGYLNVEMPLVIPNSRQKERAELLLESFEASLLEVATEYADYIELKIEE